MSTSTSTTAPPPGAEHPIKAKHRALWALGDYDHIATQVIPALGTALVDAAAIRPGERVLDVAAGSGNATLPAAAAGGRVTALDLCPELVQIGRDRSARAGLDIDWHEGDAEHLPFADDSADVTLSCVGIMFAPFHQPVADELVRVTRSGGRILLANWTPSGFIGQLFATLKPYVPAAPEGASPPPLWGDADHVAALFGDRVDLTCTRHELPVPAFASAVEFRDTFRDRYGPTIAAYRNVADDPERTAQLDQDLLAVARRFGADSGPMAWEYLLVQARVR